MKKVQPQKPGEWKKTYFLFLLSLGKLGKPIWNKRKADTFFFSSSSQSHCFIWKSIVLRAFPLLYFFLFILHLGLCDQHPTILYVTYDFFDCAFKLINGFFVRQKFKKISHITNNYNPSFILAFIIIITVGEDGVLVN